jgi:tRNA G18 (ribose-2'-O)-methylase SpoU
VVACVPTRSNVKISAIARTASVSGVQRLVLRGNARLISKIARDGDEQLNVEVRRTLPAIPRAFRAEGYRIVGVEQATNSQNLQAFEFHRRTVLVIGNERLDISEEVLTLLDDVVGTPVYGMPHSYNAARPQPCTNIVGSSLPANKPRLDPQRKKVLSP